MTELAAARLPRIGSVSVCNSHRKGAVPGKPRRFSWLLGFAPSLLSLACLDFDIYVPSGS